MLSPTPGTYTVEGKGMIVEAFDLKRRRSGERVGFAVEGDSRVRYRLLSMRPKVPPWVGSWDPESRNTSSVSSDWRLPKDSSLWSTAAAGITH